VSTPLDRFNDLQRQGFMRIAYAKPRRKKLKPVCQECMEHDSPALCEHGKQAAVAMWNGTHYE
jgi:hypothetical protein